MGTWIRGLPRSGGGGEGSRVWVGRARAREMGTCAGGDEKEGRDSRTAADTVEAS